ncbi:hypothetical protein [Methylobacterium sp. WL8]|uniref:hypothetical protein n=1 Tax=Methylobacterium sp. WL8 TaxID=2603899 RepID=UPI00164F11DA|nr:hypothetical protein [Methylobacterium sp. WL8]
MTARLILGTALGLALSTTAFAQSFTAPAGIPAALAPGGLKGRAAVPNALDAAGHAPRGYGRDVYGADDGLVTGSLRDARDARAYRGR